MVSPLLILSHLGLGDMLVCNGLVREFAATGRQVVVVCKSVSVPTVHYMYRDMSNVHLLPIADDSCISPAFGADPTCLHGISKLGYEILLLGLHAGPLVAGSGFADKFYEEAKVPRDARYSAFFVEKHEQVERTFDTTDNEPYIFVHDDPDRGIVLDIDTKFKLVHPGKADHRPGSANIFSFVGVMRGAAQLHLCDSVYAHLADHLDICPNRRYLHCYAKNPTDQCEKLFRRPGWRFIRQISTRTVAETG